MEHKVKVIDGQESPDFDVTEGGRWITFCETHGFFVQHTGRAVARDMAKSPETWCEGPGAYENPPAVEQFFVDHPEIAVANAASIENAGNVPSSPKAPRAVKFHTEHFCVVCIGNKTKITEGEKARDNLRAKKRAVAKNFKITAKERAEKIDAIDSTIFDWVATERMAKEAQVEHMKGS